MPPTVFAEPSETQVEDEQSEYRNKAAIHVRKTTCHNPAVCEACPIILSLLLHADGQRNLLLQNN